MSQINMCPRKTKEKEHIEKKSSLAFAEKCWDKPIKKAQYTKKEDPYIVHKIPTKIEIYPIYIFLLILLFVESIHMEYVQLHIIIVKKVTILVNLWIHLPAFGPPQKIPHKNYSGGIALSL